jgi:hypothetical protein
MQTYPFFLSSSPSMSSSSTLSPRMTPVNMVGDCCSFRSPTHILLSLWCPCVGPPSALLCSAEVHIGGVRVGGREDLAGPGWVRGPHRSDGGQHRQGRM